MAEHFSNEGDGIPTAPGRFVRVSDVAPVEFAPGLRFQPIVGERVMTSFVTFEPHAEAPVHRHEEEQLVVVLEGELEFTIGDETRLMTPGDMAVIPAWVPHGARTLDSSCVEVDIFNPPRETLLAHARAAEATSEEVGH